MHDRLPYTSLSLSSWSLRSSLQLPCCLEIFTFILKPSLNDLTTERFNVHGLADLQYVLTWQIIPCGFVLPSAQWLTTTPVPHAPLEIQSQFLILWYLTKKPEHTLAMQKTLLTNLLATDCRGILSETWIWAILRYKSWSRKLFLLEQLINVDPVRTEKNFSMYPNSTENRIDFKWF